MDCAGFSAVELLELTPFFFFSHIPAKFSFYFNSQINQISRKVMQTNSSLKKPQQEETMRRISLRLCSSYHPFSFLYRCLIRASFHAESQRDKVHLC